MPRSSNPDGIDWVKSAARKVLLEDLEEGVLRFGSDVVSAQEAWEHYRHLDEVANVIFDQFKKHLHGHPQQVGLKKTHIQKQLEALDHDRQLHPKRQVDRQGKRVFYNSDAQPLLVEDIKDEKHTEYGADGLFYTRKEYLNSGWTIQEFCKRVRQESAWQKFFYYLEYKRAKKAAKQKDKMPDIFAFNSDDEDDDDDGAAGNPNSAS